MRGARPRKAQLRDLFAIFDEDGSGDLGSGEIMMLLEAFGHTTNNAAALVGEYDVDGDGALSFGEFMDLMRHPIKEDPSTSARKVAERIAVERKTFINRRMREVKMSSPQRIELKHLLEYERRRGLSPPVTFAAAAAARKANRKLASAAELHAIAIATAVRRVAAAKDAAAAALQSRVDDLESQLLELSCQALVSNRAKALEKLKVTKQRQNQTARSAHSDDYVGLQAAFETRLAIERQRSNALQNEIDELRSSPLQQRRSTRSRRQSQESDGVGHGASFPSSPRSSTPGGGRAPRSPRSTTPGGGHTPRRSRARSGGRSGGSSPLFSSLAGPPFDDAFVLLPPAPALKMACAACVAAACAVEAAFAAREAVAGAEAAAHVTRTLHRRLSLTAKALEAGRAATLATAANKVPPGATLAVAPDVAPGAGAPVAALAPPTPEPPTPKPEHSTSATYRQRRRRRWKRSRTPPHWRAPQKSLLCSTRATALRWWCARSEDRTSSSDARRCAGRSARRRAPRDSMKASLRRNERELARGTPAY